MEFLSEECDEWYGSDRPPSGLYAEVLNTLKQAPRKLPPHDVWLQRVLGMPDYRR